MATENKSKPSNSNKNSKKRKHYLPHNKPVKKGSYPLCPGVEGFFITCDGGREHQASNEAINVIDSFYEELVDGTESKVEQADQPKKPLNKIIKFASSDSSSSDDDDDDDDNDDDAKEDNPETNDDVQTSDDKKKDAIATGHDAEKQTRDDENKDAIVTGGDAEKQTQENIEKPENQKSQEAEAVEPPAKKQCVETDATSRDFPKKVENKSVDKLIEEELAELGDRSKRRFSKLDSGCNGVIFIQMRKRDGDPSPKDIVHHMMTSIASTKKHVSRFLLRVLPVEVTCYTSEEEIKRAMKPLVNKYFPEETQTPRKVKIF
ncbi:hypothetical protein CDL12_13480 [Handroanthus impetiginosus]|uniref:THUMP domain-containing protein n=1 Tax=Handroanthus impetiginosus TaxID=429701 RepID=A0A2G9H8P9_9LAMI|nr:hypothetical protein CDL12_13480 [Handroanthus impetiginosus]